MHTLVSALMTADADAIAACFTDDARLRALTPPGLHERAGSAEIAALMASWFADCDQTELVSTASSWVVDREHISYRIAANKMGRGHCLIEQQLYAVMDGGLFADLSLVCSGFRPTS